MSGVSTDKLEAYTEEFYDFSSTDKFAFVRKNSNDKWSVITKSGQSLGEYDTQTAAAKRLRHIEFLKHKRAETNNPSLSYSSIIRMLNKEYSEETVKNFQRLFKENFDRLYLEGNNEPENDALEIAISSIKNFHKNANAIEMGNPDFAGKRLSDLVRFLLRRIPSDKRSKAIMSMRRKIYMINEYELSGRKTPPHSSMGQVLTLIKLILLEHNPEYMRNVINALVRNL